MMLWLRPIAFRTFAGGRPEGDQVPHLQRESRMERIWAMKLLETTFGIASHPSETPANGCVANGKLASPKEPRSRSNVLPAASTVFSVGCVE